MKNPFKNLLNIFMKKTPKIVKMDFLITDIKDIICKDCIEYDICSPKKVCGKIHGLVLAFRCFYEEK